MEKDTLKIKREYFAINFLLKIKIHPKCFFFWGACHHSSVDRLLFERVSLIKAKSLAALVASQNCKDKKKDWSGCTLGPIGPISGSQIPAPPVLHMEKVQACNQPPIGTKTKIDPWEPKLEPEPFYCTSNLKIF
jgi:hypothetical protein